MPPIPQPSGKLIILHPQFPAPIAISLLHVQVNSCQEKGKFSFLQGSGLYLYSSESHA